MARLTIAEGRLLRLIFGWAVKNPAKGSSVSEMSYKDTVHVSKMSIKKPV